MIISFQLSNIYSYYAEIRVQFLNINLLFLSTGLKTKHIYVIFLKFSWIRMIINEIYSCKKL